MTQRTVTLKEPIPAPISSEACSNLARRPTRWITFRHPWYSDAFEQNILFTLRPYDDKDGGLQYGVAFSACAIVAGNAWNGWLQETKEGDKVKPGWDDLLYGTDYYFFLPSSSQLGERPAGPSTPSCIFRYPIVPSFQHWSYPHDGFPEQWSAMRPISISSFDAEKVPPPASGVTDYVNNRDRWCVISKYRDNPQRAHLCPRSETTWFQENRMEQYNVWAELEPAVDDIANSFLLRSDLHTAFDKYKKFVITPKQSQWAVHFLEPTLDFGSLYHNTPIALAPSISPNFLLVRFAWAILPRLGAFLKTNSSKLLKLRVKKEDGMAEEVKSLTKNELSNLLDSERARTPSPSKKKRGAPDQNDPKDNDDIAPDEHTTHRGRKRFRSQSEEYAREFGADGASTTRTSFGSSGSSMTLASSMDIPDRSEEGQDLQSYKRQYIVAQRPKDPDLICCDYNAAERASKLGLPRTGTKENGGALLCLECLGVEYRDDPA